MAVEPPTRKPCRFQPSAAPEDPDHSTVPEAGLCLSVFPILTEPRRPDRVLMGRYDASFDWRRIGAISRDRVEKMQDLWLLPGRHLFLYEDPKAAVATILWEQLGLENHPLRGLEAISESWEPPHAAGHGSHWDISFIYRGEWPMGRQLHAAPWRELAFKNPLILDPAQVGRGHLDVLAMAGFTVPPGDRA